MFPKQAKYVVEHFLRPSIHSSIAETERSALSLDRCRAATLRNRGSFTPHIYRGPMRQGPPTCLEGPDCSKELMGRAIGASISRQQMAPLANHSFAHGSFAQMVAFLIDQRTIFRHFDFGNY
jgi:hypothetical protein